MKIQNADGSWVFAAGKKVGDNPIAHEACVISVSLARRKRTKEGKIITCSANHDITTILFRGQVPDYVDGGIDIATIGAFDLVEGPAKRGGTTRLFGDLGHATVDMVQVKENGE